MRLYEPASLQPNSLPFSGTRPLAARSKHRPSVRKRDPPPVPGQWQWQWHCRGLSRTAGWHAVGSRRAGVIALEATVRFGSDTLIPRAPGVCLKKHGLVCRWHWDVHVGRVRVTKAAEGMRREFNVARIWAGKSVIWRTGQRTYNMNRFVFFQRVFFLICSVLKILCTKHFVVIPVV